MSSGPQLRFYKDENLKANQLDKLTKIYNLFREDNPKYISRNECLSLKAADSFLFVFSNFEGPAFEHLSSLKSRIISVQCMLTSLKTNKKLPRSPSPIFSFSFDNLNVCCTNIEKKQREKIYNMVALMRGKTSKIFTESVTHLVTTEVGSAKYHAAAGMKIPVMLPDWIDDVWKDSEEEDIHATDVKYLKYTCPIFNKYTICASGFPENTKADLKQMIESEGGVYNGDLVCGTTTHLIVTEAKGAKYEHAKLWKINIVKPTWVYDSKKAKYCQPEKNYAVEASTHTSTPTESRQLKPQHHKAPEIDISVISKPHNPQNATKLVNETENATRLNMSNSMLNASANNNPNLSMSATLNRPAPPKKPETKTISNYADLPKELNLIGKIKLDLLDGIGIYHENFESIINQKINKICNSGGAIKFDEYNSDVTHVIVNQVNETKCKSYIELNPEVNIVTIDWLIDSCKQNQLVDCKNYTVHKNALNSVKTPKKRARPERQSTVITELSAFQAKSEDSELNGYLSNLSQYYTAEATTVKKLTPAVTTATKQFTPTGSASEMETTGRRISMSVTSTTPQEKNQGETLSDSRTQRLSIQRMPPLPNKLPTKPGVFNDKKMQIIGFDDGEMQSLESVLLEKGATIVSFEPNVSMVTREVIDYTLMPKTLPSRCSNNNPATVYWMRKCIEQNKLIELTDDVFYQPIPKYNTDKPLVDCVITVSGFSSHEKENITTLCSMLGAKMQQSLSLKKTADVLANTHLICNKAIGPKYIAAKSWHMPIVGSDWVIDCCVTGNKADEEKYSIENQRDPKELIKALAAIRQTEANESNMSTTSYGMGKSNETGNNTTLGNASNAAPRRESFLEVQEVQDNTEPQNHNDSSLTAHNDSKRIRLDDQEVEKSPKNQEPPMSTTASEHNSAKASKPPQNAMRGMNTPGYGTPVINPRINHLRRTESNFSPMQPKDATGQENTNIDTNNTSIEYENTKQSKLALSTPNWMKSKKDGENLIQNPAIDYEKAIQNFQTPELKRQTKKAEALNDNGNNTPLDQLFTKAINVAYANSQIPNFYKKYDSPEVFEYSFDKSYNNKGSKASDSVNIADDEDDRITPTPCDVKKAQQTLKNTRIFVSRKLVKQQTEIYQVAECLGAEFLWTYNETCTHFIYSGKLSDTNKELKTAKEQNKHIVNVNWIYACKEQGKLVYEADYAIQANAKRTSMAMKKSLAGGAVESPLRVPVEKKAAVEREEEPKSEFQSKQEGQKVAADDLVAVEESKEVPTEPESETTKDQSMNQVTDNDETREEEPSEEAQNVEPEPVVEVNEEYYSEETRLSEAHNQSKEKDMPAPKEPEPIPEIIPDSMDIKINFLDQLQDKLDIINKSKSTNKSKWSRSTSDKTPVAANNNDTDLESSELQNESTSRRGACASESESQLLANMNFENMSGNNMNSDETCLSEDQALRELNNSRSRWGLSSGGSDNSTHNKKKSRSIEKADIDQNEFNMENLSENDDMKRKVNKSDSNKDKSLKVSNKLNKLDADEHDDSPSITKTKRCVPDMDMEPPACSQVQMTIWKEDQMSQMTTTNTGRGKSRSVANNQKTAIAERIISASRASAKR